MKGRNFSAILRHCVVEVIKFLAFTISGVKGRFKIFVSIDIANFIQIRNEKFKVISRLNGKIRKIINSKNHAS